MILGKVSDYFFKDGPKQFFVGAELCARWVLLLKGEAAPKATEKVVSYFQGAQDALPFWYAGKALFDLTGRVVAWDWGIETAKTMSELAGQALACGDIAIKEFFGLPVRLKVLGFAADGISGVMDLVGGLKSSGYVMKMITVVKAVASLFMTIVAVGVHFGVQNYLMPRAMLVIDTTMFMLDFSKYLIQ